MSYTDTDYTAEEIESRGEATFLRQIRDRLSAGHRGKFLVIDVETGEYEIDEDDLMATRRLLTNRPNAVIYGLRIGILTAFRIGTIDPLPRSINPEGLWEQTKPITSEDIAEVRNEMWREFDQGVPR